MIRSPWVAALLLQVAWAGHAMADTPIPLPPDAVARLKSSDAQQIESALGDVRVSGRGGAPAVPAVVELLRRGLPEALTKAAIETLGDTQNEAGSEVVAWYTRDRSPLVRQSAVGALAKLKGNVATKALRAALSDSDPAVRG